MLVFEKNEEMAPYKGVSRTGYTFTFIRPLHSYALFGGVHTDNELYLFNISKGVWNLQPTGGSKKPPSRRYHAAAFIEGVSCLLVHGGEDVQNKCVQDFYALSIKDWKWRKLIVVKYPEARICHCLFAKSENELILFGGISYYQESISDIWQLNAQYERGSKQESVSLECSKIESKSKFLPEGRFLAEGACYCNGRLFAASLGQKSDLLRVYCYDFRQNEWQELELGARCTQARMFRAVRLEEEGFVLVLSDPERRKIPPQFYFFDALKNTFRTLQDETDLFNNCDQFCGEGGQSQILCFRQGKRLFTVRYAVLRAQQPQSSIEDYLIAIKHEQILSQQLARKNSQLEELYREMQNYITQLHKQYIRFEEDTNVQAERIRHIEDCHFLKREYSKLDRLYDSASEQVRALRGQLGAINEDFQRCMQTQFDEEA